MAGGWQLCQIGESALASLPIVIGEAVQVALRDQALVRSHDTYAVGAILRRRTHTSAYDRYGNGPMGRVFNAYSYGNARRSPLPVVSKRFIGALKQRAGHWALCPAACLSRSMSRPRTAGVPPTWTAWDSGTYADHFRGKELTLVTVPALKGNDQSTHGGTTPSRLSTGSPTLLQITATARLPSFRGLRLTATPSRSTVSAA